MAVPIVVRDASPFRRCSVSRSASARAVASGVGVNSCDAALVSGYAGSADDQHPGMTAPAWPRAKGCDVWVRVLV